MLTLRPEKIQIFEKFSEILKSAIAYKQLLEKLATAKIFLEIGRNALFSVFEIVHIGDLSKSGIAHH